MQRTGTAVLGIVMLLAAAPSLGGQTSGQSWSEKWKADNKQWIACHLRRSTAASGAHRTRM